MSNSDVVRRLALEAEAALAQLLIKPTATVWSDDRRKLEAALEVIRKLAT